MSGVLLVGNFLSEAVGTRGVCEELADRLRGAGWCVLTTSARAGKVARLADMVSTVWARGRRLEHGKNTPSICSQALAQSENQVERLRGL